MEGCLKSFDIKHKKDEYVFENKSIYLIFKKYVYLLTDFAHSWRYNYIRFSNP